MVGGHGKAKLILASKSTGRVDLLAQIGIKPDLTLAADVDESPVRDELAGPLAKRLAVAKAQDIAARYSGSWELGGDTVVSLGRRILGKPDDKASARLFLELLSGRRHSVFGGVAVLSPSGKIAVRLVKTSVVFKRLEKNEIEDYLQFGEWKGKAGGYAIQGRAGSFVRQLSGSYFNVVGLPLYETVSLLKGLGFAMPRPSGNATNG